MLPGLALPLCLGLGQLRLQCSRQDPAEPSACLAQRMGPSLGCAPAWPADFSSVQVHLQGLAVRLSSVSVLSAAPSSAVCRVTAAARSSVCWDRHASRPLRSSEPLVMLGLGVCHDLAEVLRLGASNATVSPASATWLCPNFLLVLLLQEKQLLRDGLGLHLRRSRVTLVSLGTFWSPSMSLSTDWRVASSASHLTPKSSAARQASVSRPLRALSIDLAKL